jgi:hypothetical protein
VYFIVCVFLFQLAVIIKPDVHKTDEFGILLIVISGAVFVSSKVISSVHFLSLLVNTAAITPFDVPVNF